MLRKLFQATTVANLILSVSFAQTENPVSHISKALSLFFQKYPQEKVYLQFDRTRYATDDTIWYKAYVTYDHAPSPVSSVLYVEIFDDAGKIIKRQVLPVEDGGASGDIALGGDFPASKYYCRAYTSWMMNFDPSFYFYKDIDIGWDESSIQEPETAGDSSHYFIEFFPEGGHLVAGLTSLVAFKAFDQNGFPVNAKGRIVDSAGKTIDELTTVHDGMGSFILHPLAGVHYSAIVEGGSGTTKVFPLPETRTSGIVLHAQAMSSFNGDSVYFRISRTVAAKELYQHLIICSEMQGVYDFTYIDFDTTSAGNYNNRIIEAPTPLAVQQFPPGILHLSVFNDSGDLLAQRLIFLEAARQESDIELQPGKLNLAPHAQNVFTLRVPGDLQGNYAVAVTDADAEKQDPGHGNITSDLLLTSDLKTYLKNPGWYFDNGNPQRSEALDLLMLTSRWSRFDWNNVLAGRFPTLNYFPEQSLQLKGRVFMAKDKSKKPLSNGELPIMIKEADGSLKNILSAPVDSLGYFTLSGLDFYDTAIIYVKNAAEKKNRSQEISVQFEISPVDSIHYARLPDYALDLSGKRIDLTRRRRLNPLPDSVAVNQLQFIHKDKTLLNPVTIRARIKTHTDSTIAEYATGLFANPNEWSLNYDFTSDKIAAHTYHINVLQYIMANVPGIVVYWQSKVSAKDIEDIPHLTWRMTNSLFYGGMVPANVPAIFLNDAQLTGEGGGDYRSAIDLLESIPLANVALIRVFPPGTKAAVSGNSPHGVIVIYTINKREARDDDYSNLFDKIKKLGYSRTHHFSSPDYAARKNISVPDTRKTLYWDPMISTDSVTHSAVFSFYNNDMTKRIHVVIEGIDKNGKLIRTDRIFP